MLKGDHVETKDGGIEEEDAKKTQAIRGYVGPEKLCFIVRFPGQGGQIHRDWAGDLRSPTDHLSESLRERSSRGS